MSLIPAEPVPEAVQAARIAELGPWVEAFRKENDQLWPAPGTGASGPAGSYRRRYPWPECWTEHRALVRQMISLRSWTQALDRNDMNAAAFWGGGYDRWERHIREVTAPLVQDISRVCMVAGVCTHVDMSKPRQTADTRGSARRRRSPVRVHVGATELVGFLGT